MKWILVPVPAILTPYTIWEHTPVYSHKEYPRYINKPGWQQPKTEWRLIDTHSKESNENL